MNFDVAEESLNQSVFAVVIQYKAEIVGMERVVGVISEYLKEKVPEKSIIG